MQARYANDAARGRGYGFFVIRGARAAAGERCAFSVQRAGDGRNLGIAGWQEAEESLLPDRVEFREDELILAVSPPVVNSLDELETYRLTLRVAGRPPQRGALELSAILYADMTSGNGLAQTPPTPEPRPEPDEPAPEPDPEPLRVPDPEPARRKSLAPALVLGALILAAAVAAGWWLVNGERKTTETVQPPDTRVETQDGEKRAQESEPPKNPEETPSAVESPAVIEEPAATGNQSAPEAAPAQEPGRADPQGSAGTPQTPAAPPPVEQSRGPKARVHEFMRRGGAPAEALALSRTLPTDTEEGQDAVFLLQEMAAEGGDPMAMIGVGRYYDPSDAAPAGTIAKDMEQAWLWYAKALDAGAADARSALDRLRTWLAGEAAKGSARARDLLRRMP